MCVRLGWCFKIPTDCRWEEVARKLFRNWCVGVETMRERTEGGLEPMFVPIGWLSGLPKNFRLLDSKGDHRFHSGTQDPFF